MKKFSMSYSWTQPYSVSMNPFYQKSELTINEELERLQEIDDQVAVMKSYPDAEKILKKILNDK